VRKIFLSALLGSLAAAASAATAAKPVSDDVIRSLTRCSTPFNIGRQPLNWKLPQGVAAQVISIQSDSSFCATQFAALTTPSGRFFLGSPWPLADVPGTREEKIKAFGWQRMHDTLSATIDPKKSVDGFDAVRLVNKTEYGDIVTEGWIDKAGLLYIPGDLHPANADVVKSRFSRAQKVIDSSPSTGPMTAAITVVEFSDFQCPSCRAASSYVKPVLAKYGNRIRYVRVDYPLISSHPWAFAASAAGRAIHRQNPDLFWKYKDWVYENQSELSIFTVEDFARAFVQDNGLDVARFNKEMASPEVRAQILAGIATGSAIDIAATPTFMVNGVFVDPGARGAALDSYLAQRLGGK
jgi:protein-disulfide isomerase